MKDMRSGNYAIHKSKEYKFISKTNNQILLISNDPIDLLKGFFPSKQYNGFIKAVLRDSVEEVYSIFTFGTYKEQEFGIRDEDENRFYLEGGNNRDIMLKLGFDEIERGVYRKWVYKSEVEKIREEKTSL